MNQHELLGQINEAVDTLEDQTVSTGGDFTNEPHPAGLTPARFVGYVEVGVRAQKPYQGKDKPDAEEVRLYFELNGPKHRRVVDVNGVPTTFTNVISVKLAKKLGDKAGYKKLFNKMTYGRDSIKHMASMLGEGFLINIVHDTVPGVDGKPAKTYANMRDSEGTYLISAPMIANPLEGTTTPVPVPEPTQPLRLLLWARPTKEQWASIFIDGTRTVKDAKGQEREVSKNWLQEDIVQNAKNFAGSPLQIMLGGLGDLSLDAAPEVAAGTPAAAPEPVAGGEVASPAPAATKQDLKPADGAPAADPLAALGLV